MELTLRSCGIVTILLAPALVHAAAISVPSSENPVVKVRPTGHVLKKESATKFDRAAVVFVPDSEVLLNREEGGTAGALPSTEVYRNTLVNPSLTVYRPGANQRMADDLTLASGDCAVTSYLLRVAGLNQGGGPTFDVHTALWDGDPCLPGSALIPGTEGSFLGNVNDGTVYDLELTLDPIVPVPGTVWLAATFSTNDSGWIRAEAAEVGSTANVWSEDHVQLVPEEPGTACTLFLFSATGTPWAGFWATVNCDLPGVPVGACCNGITCTQTTEADCVSGVWMGAFTTCQPNVCLSGACCTGGTFATCTDTTEDQCAGGLFHAGQTCATGACGPTYKVFENSFATGIFDTIDATNTKWADDLLLGPGAPCSLAGYELLVAGDGDTGPLVFNMQLELWTNDDRGTPTLDNDDIPGALIPGTQSSFQNIPADLFSKRLLAGPFSGIDLPKKVWIVMTSDATNAGPITAGPAAIGFSIDGFAIFNAPGAVNVWTTGFWYGGFDPQGCPGPTCTPAGSFRVQLWCEGTPPTGACCNASSGTCTEGVREADCSGRWIEGAVCDPDPFEPVCGAAACCFPQHIPPNPPVILCLDTTPAECALMSGDSAPGKFCGEVTCPPLECIVAEGDCRSTHGTPGCEDAFCCAIVCDPLTGDPFCCETEWDLTCAQAAVDMCPQPLLNDNCDGAQPVATGTFNFDTTDATTDGPSHLACATLGGDEQIIDDIWYCWTASCTGNVLVRTCGLTQVDTKIAVYEGCMCPPTDLGLLDCDDDRCAPRQSMASFNAVSGQEYLIRLGSYPGEPGGTGSAVISCGPPNHPACPAAGDCCTGHAPAEACSDEVCCETVCTCDSFCCTTEWDDACATTGFNENGCGAEELCPSLCDPACPTGVVNWVDPPNGAVDARRPHPPNDPATPEGLRVFNVQAPLGSGSLECWDLCETQMAGTPNSVESVTDNGRGSYALTLARPITPGAATTLTHLGSGATATFIFHPGNVNADAAASPSDILELIDHLNGVRVPPLNNWQCDIDRSTQCGPADILAEIDLLNGASGFQVWNGTAKPATAGCP